MVLLLVLLSLLCSFLVSSTVLRQKNLIHVVTFALILFYLEYLVFSSVLLYFEIFQVEYCLYAQLATNAVLILILRSRLKKALCNIEVDWKELCIVVILVGVALACSSLKTERIWKDSDDGLYYCKAITLTYKDTNHTRELEEYGQISKSVDDGVIALQGTQAGLYTSLQTDEVLEYEYHGLPLWPAVMALFIKLFGIFNGPIALSFVFIIAILAAYCSVEIVATNKNNKYFVFPFFAFMPLILYLSKMSLAEMAYVALLFSAYFLILNKNLYLLAGIALGLLGFIHISAFLYIPALVVIFFFVSLFTKDYKYGIVNLIMSATYLMSLESAYKLSNIYSEVNMQYTVFGYDIVVIIKICFAIAIVGQLLALVQLQKNYKLVELAKNFYSCHIRSILKIIVIFLAIFTIYQGYLLGFTDKYITGVGSWTNRANYANQGFSSLLKLNIISILMATGYVFVPYLIYCVFSKKKKLSQHDIVLTLIFLEAMAIYTIIRCDTATNYCGSRYFALMIVPVAIILMGRLIDTQKKLIIMSSCAILTSLPFVVTLIPMQCMGGTIGLYQDVASSIGQGAIVLIDKNDLTFSRILANSLREINGSKVYELSNWKEVSAYYTDQPCYVIVTDQTDLTDDLVQALGENVLRNSYVVKGDINNLGAFYPLEQGKLILDVSAYLISKEQLNYQFGDAENFTLSGFHGNEHTFRWTTDCSSFEATLDSDAHYDMKLNILSLPPLEALNREKLDFKILANGVEIAAITLTKTSPLEFVVPIPEGVLKKGLSTNTITIISETWQPSEYGSPGDRYLGIPVQSVEFIKTGEQTDYYFGDSEDFELFGFYGNEHTYRWTTDCASFEAKLNGDSMYNMKLTLNAIPPLGMLHKESLTFTILINEMEIETINLTANSPTEFIIPVGDGILKEGLSSNTVTIVSETWQPSEYGSSDDRNLGIAVRKVEFERTN